MHHLSLWQRVTDKDRIDRLEIELGSEIHDGQVLVVELAMLLRRIAVAFDQMQEQILMRLDMAIEVHAHEAVQLQKTGIDVPHHTRMREWHLGNDVIAEPAES